MSDLDQFYSNPELLEAIRRNQQYATGQQPTMPTPYVGPQIPKENSPYAPDANSVINTLKGIGHSAQDTFQRMKRGVTQGPYSSPTGEYDPRIGLLGPELMAGPGLGTAVAERTGANILGAAGSRLKQQWPGRAGPGIWSQEVKNSLKNIANDVEISGGTINDAIKKFREANPGLNVTDTAIRQAMYRMRNERPSGLVAKGWKQEYDQTLENLVRNVHGTNTPNRVILEDFKKVHPEFGMSDRYFNDKVMNIKDKYRITGDEIPDRDFTLGALGGSGRRPPSKLNTESSGEAMNWLQSQKPVDTEWVKNWAERAGVPIEEVNRVISGGRRTSKTDYVKLKDPAGETVKVRVPLDADRHHGRPPYPHEVGNVFDTGIGKSNHPFDERTLINQSAMSYANPEALDAALKWRFSTAPDKKNWLVSPDLAPRLEMTGTQPSNITKSLPSDPDQLKLLSTGAPLHNDIPLENPYSLNEKVDERLKQQEIDRQIIEHQDRYRGKAPHNVPVPQKGNLISTYDILKALYGTP